VLDDKSCAIFRDAMVVGRVILIGEPQTALDKSKNRVSIFLIFRDAKLTM
jgi:hypothetical protein